MNCFRHPNEVAVVYCKGCSKPLCWNCSQQIFGNQNHVCSEACAKVAAQQPEPEDLPDSLFHRIYALVFLTLLLAGIGGGLCVWGGQSAIARQDYYMGRKTRNNLFEIFVLPGLRDWRVEFGIGATVGAVCAIRFYIRDWRGRN